MKKFDAIIIGSGQGGTPLSKKLAEQGWHTALIEKDKVGGTCVNVGCTPTKTMIASAKALYTIRGAKPLGVQVGEPAVDMAAVIGRKNSVVESFRSGSEKGLRQTPNLELVAGTATFTAPKTMRVSLRDGTGMEASADHIFIDTGTRPRVPEIEGLEEVGYFTSATLMAYKEVPPHLLIIGGGYIALEFGQMYRRFGSEVTILEHSKQFLSREDRDIAGALRQILEEEGITIHTGAAASKAARRDGQVQVSVEKEDGILPLTCTHLLVAAGRQPNTEDLNAAAAGVALTEKGYIKTDNFLQTTAEGIYALGDVKGGPEFTHISYDDYRVVYHNLFQKEKRTIENRLVPYTVFTDPQLGRVGLTEQEAKEKGLPVKVAVLKMKQVARALEVGDTRGLIKAVVDAQSGQVLGAAVLGSEGGETMTLLQMAMVGGVRWEQLKDMVIAHPLYAESLNNLFAQLD